LLAYLTENCCAGVTECCPDATSCNPEKGNE
jgi:ArsR family transcriptional regulator, arsenate/arsenite/antimonite-responsive transcriptional repressor